MERLAGLTATATLVVREADVKKGEFGAAVSAFASTVRARTSSDRVIHRSPELTQ